MRSQQEPTGLLFSYISTEDRIPASHPLQQGRRLAHQALDASTQHSAGSTPGFVGLNPDDPGWHPTTLTKNQDRLLNEGLMAHFLKLLLATPEVKPLLSSEHFSVDGTLLGLPQLVGAHRRA